MALRTWIRSAVGMLAETEQHPLATRRGLVEVLVALPTGTPHEALQDLCDCYHSLDTPDLGWDAQAAALVQLDEAAFGCIENLWFRLHASTEHEDLFDRYRNALAHYAAVFTEHVARLLDAHGQLPQPNRMQTDAAIVLCGRAVAALGSLKRARYLARDFVPADFWRRLYGLFQFARRGGATVRSFEPYRQQPATTIRREFLRVVMLDTIPLQSLTWRQMEIAELTICALADKFVVRAPGSDLAPFWVDLDGAQGPRRWRTVEPPKSASTLCFGPGLAYVDMANLYKTAAGGRTLPFWLVMPETDGIDNEVEITETLALTLRHWGRNPPTRQSERRPATGVIEVIDGFRQARRAIALDELARRDARKHAIAGALPGETFSSRLAAARVLSPAPTDALDAAIEMEALERWELIDESDSGIGAVIAGRPPWLRVGSLVGHRTASEPPSRWGIAVVSRLGRDPRSRPLAGMSRIPGDWALARFVSSDTSSNNPWVVRYALDGCPVYDALADPAAARLITDNRHFAPGLVGILRFASGQKHVRLTALGGRGHDHEWWAYEEVSDAHWEQARATVRPPTPRR